MHACAEIRSRYKDALRVKCFPPMQQQRCRALVDTRRAEKKTIFGVDTGERAQTSATCVWMINLPRKMCRYRSCTMRSSCRLPRATNKHMARAGHESGDMVGYDRRKQEQVRQLGQRHTAVVSSDPVPGEVRGAPCSRLTG